MKTSTILTIILAVLAIVMGILWFNATSAKQKIAAQNDSIKASFENATNTINEIQSSLDSIESFSGMLFSGN